RFSPACCAVATALCARCLSATPRRSRSCRRRSPLPEFASLEGKVALVTGGSRGIGAAISRELGAAGAKVAVNYRSDEAAAEEVAGEIGGVAMQADVSVSDEAVALVEKVESELGDIAALVNNAGVTRDTLIARMSDDD